MDNAPKQLSATSIADKLHQTAQIVNQKLVDMRLITYNGKTYDLTQDGKSKGGVYKYSDKLPRYIVWPESIINELQEPQENDSKSINATALGQHFGITPIRINSILSELGWITRDLKGWQLTNLGARMGGIQSRDQKSGVPYVRWPSSIHRNSILVATVNEAKGDEPQPITQTQIKEATPDAVGFRDKFPPQHRTQDGHYVRSKSEVIIDNCLYNYKVVHAYERKVPIDEEMYCDFYIPTAKVYIEYWGLDDEKYAGRKEKKLDLYKRNTLKLIQLSEKDVSNLDDTLPGKLLALGVTVE